MHFASKVSEVDCCQADDLLELIGGGGAVTGPFVAHGLVYRGRQAPAGFEVFLKIFDGFKGGQFTPARNDLSLVA